MRPLEWEVHWGPWPVFLANKSCMSPSEVENPLCQAGIRLCKCRRNGCKYHHDSAVFPKEKQTWTSFNSSSKLPELALKVYEGAMDLPRLRRPVWRKVSVNLVELNAKILFGSTNLFFDFSPGSRCMPVSLGTGGPAALPTRSPYQNSVWGPSHRLVFAEFATVAALRRSPGSRCQLVLVVRWRLPTSSPYQNSVWGPSHRPGSAEFVTSVALLRRREGRGADPQSRIKSNSIGNRATTPTGPSPVTRRDPQSLIKSNSIGNRARPPGPVTLLGPGVARQRLWAF